MSPKSPSRAKKSPSRKKKDKNPPHRLITENIECLAIAIVITLILNQFFLQAYKIPTGSMQPTLMGNQELGIVDRVLVNKFLYLFSEPSRWDVVVFKYPLNQSENYIKRLIGLPGEKVTLQDGDIYIDDRIARKPEPAIRATAKKIFPGNQALESVFTITEGGKATGPERVSFSEPGLLSTRETVRCEFFHGYDPGYDLPHPAYSVGQNRAARDLRIAFRVRLEKGAGGIRAEIREEGKAHRFLLLEQDNPGASSLATEPQGKGESPGDPASRKAFPNPLEGESWHHLVLSNIDDRLTVRVDGVEVASLDYDYEGNPSGRNRNRVEFGPIEGGAVIEEIALYRDIYYLPACPGPGKTVRFEPRSFQVPPGHYFMLGDNTQNSVDSREWLSSFLSLKSGERFKSETAPSIGTDTTVTPRGSSLRDQFGQRRFISQSDENSNHLDDLKPDPFVPARLLSGKALVVFWPLYPHFRPRLLR